MVRRTALVVALASTGCGGCRKAPPVHVTETLATETAAGLMLGAIAVDESTVYWLRSDMHATSLVAVSKSGGAPSVRATVAEPQGASLVVDGANAYFITAPYAFPQKGSVWTVQKSGGSAKALALGEADPHALAADASHLYWLTTEDVRALPIAGGAATTLAAGQHHPVDLAVSSDEVYWLTGERFDLSAVDLGLKKISVHGGAPRVLATFHGDLLGFALGPTDAYVLTDQGHAEMPGERAIVRVPRAGGAPTKILVLEGPTRALVVDGKDLYFSSDAIGSFFSNHAAVLHASAAGGKAEEIALPDPHGAATALALDATSFYWIGAGSDESAIMKSERAAPASPKR